MNKCMTIALLLSISSTVLVASDQPVRALHEDEMHAIEQAVMARLEEEAHKQTPQSKLNQAMKTEAAKRKLAARIIAGVIAVGGIAALIYWLWPKKETPPTTAGPATSTNENKNNDAHHCGCVGHHHGHGHSKHHHRGHNDPGRGPVVIVPVIVPDPNMRTADVLQEIIHDAQAQTVQQGEDEASRLRGETSIVSSPVASAAVSPVDTPVAPTPNPVTEPPFEGRTTRGRAQKYGIAVEPLFNPVFDSDSDSD
ncbi:hypothetical protein FJ365_01610 [Candidatus Dependentiae bacterium]|nr:hypothetical protein [Candidatus Dependentiae bacterium]